jgi:hypothetical protein
MNDASPGKRHYETLVVQPWGEPGKLLQATIVRVCPTVVDAFRYMDYVELTLARHGLPLDTLSDLVVVDAEAADRTASGDPCNEPEIRAVTCDGTR